MPGGNYRTLPAHLALGRGSVAGPAIGGLLVFQAHVPVLTATSPIISAGWLAPTELRVQALCVYQRVAGGTSIVWSLRKNTTFSTTGSTTIFSNSNAGNEFGMIGGPGAEDSVGQAATLNAGTRDLARNEPLFVTLHRLAAGTSNDISIYVWASAQGYAQSSALLANGSYAD